ncbi:CheR family methyltransferase [Deinococcus peraridilitoris]|uniref:Methylase of chemotaxis methyl-accepting protein n=1 Tax=Deinococcus peraridilitoris (strain DSM 19664 / LMG 22246 / CIP 109416 / KR-200) TaxID=937777 RepID=L0A365_DEIPD|nr:protein-glutamate O-methyltransferase CheR [Deinococcus peraridilitoris]AFZ67889.1 methylase of chemotaxis methyl-accepting protein [Deinococcus peraridilitoris DSM 19664]
MIHTAPDLEHIEIQLLLEGIYQRYGFDFRQYAPATLRRRVLHALREEKLANVSSLQARVLRDEAAFERLVACLAVNVTEMFRDPQFYQAFRQQVVPVLRTHPFLRIWHAGCSSGEEVYSMAILLQEEGLLERSRLYATDLSTANLARARDGIYPQRHLAQYAKNYRASGGQGDLESYFTSQYEHAIIRTELKRNIIWAQHNLVTDGSFNDFHVILCRNVLIYFNQDLQAKVHHLLHDSLAPFGLLALGRFEPLDMGLLAGRYSTLDAREKLYRKVA